VFGARRLGAKQPVVAVETVEHRLGDLKGHAGVEPLGRRLVHGWAVQWQTPVWGRSDAI